MSLSLNPRVFLLVCSLALASFGSVAMASEAQISHDGIKLSSQEAQALFVQVCVSNQPGFERVDTTAQAMGFVPTSRQGEWLSTDLNAIASLIEINGAKICNVSFRKSSSDSAYRSALRTIPGAQKGRQGRYTLNGNGQKALSFGKMQNAGNFVRAFWITIGRGA